MSPMTRLLLDRTLGMLASHKPAVFDIHLRGDFVAVVPQLVGAEIKAWVMLSYTEFLDTFALPEGGTQLQ